MKAFQLHDSQTEEIVGTVTITNDDSQAGIDELWDGWVKFNTSDFGDDSHNKESVEEFIEFFNEEYDTQIENVEVDFIQPS